LAFSPAAAALPRPMEMTIFSSLGTDIWFCSRTSGVSAGTTCSRYAAISRAGGRRGCCGVPSSTWTSLGRAPPLASWPALAACCPWGGRPPFLPFGLGASCSCLFLVFPRHCLRLVRAFGPTGGGTAPAPSLVEGPLVIYDARFFRMTAQVRLPPRRTATRVLGGQSRSSKQGRGCLCRWSGQGASRSLRWMGASFLDAARPGGYAEKGRTGFHTRLTPSTTTRSLSAYDAITRPVLGLVGPRDHRSPCRRF
jgi:hypothetical protein